MANKHFMACDGVQEFLVQFDLEKAREARNRESFWEENPQPTEWGNAQTMDRNEVPSGSKGDRASLAKDDVCNI